MARTARVKSVGEGTAYYHLVSRASNKQFLFRKSAAKDRLAELARKAAEFSGVKLVAFAVMDNHYHILCKVTRTGDPVSQGEVVRRVGILKGAKAAESLAERWRELAAAGFYATLESELGRYRARMNDISEFMKTMKELYAIWYNREYDYSGSIYVKAVQALVGATIDGKYGDNTRANVIAFQATAGLNETGCIAVNDWLALFGCEYEKVVKPVGTPAAPVTGTDGKQPVDYKQGDKRWRMKPYTITGMACNTNYSSNANLKSDCYDDFADYLATVAQHFVAMGYPIKMISPVNEPQYEWYASSNQEGSPWQNDEIARLVRELDQSLSDKGLQTQILIPEAAEWKYLTGGIREERKFVEDRVLQGDLMSRVKKD